MFYTFYISIFCFSLLIALFIFLFLFSSEDHEFLESSVDISASHISSLIILGNPGSSEEKVEEEKIEEKHLDENL